MSSSNASDQEPSLLTRAASDPAIQELSERLAASIRAQARLQSENKQAVVGLNEQIDRMRRTIAQLQSQLAQKRQRSDWDAAALAELRPEDIRMRQSKFWRLRVAYWTLRARWLQSFARWRRSPVSTDLPVLPKSPEQSTDQAFATRDLAVSRLLARPEPTAFSAPGTPGPLSSATPLFVIGCPRSGTTIVAKILNAHPAVLMTNETAVFIMLGHAVQQSRIGYAASLLYGKEHNQLWADHLAQHARPLIESFYDKIAAASGKADLRYWGEKHPHNANHFDFIDALYPAARYLYLVRDPRDTALSIAKMNQIPFPEALAVWKGLSDAHETFTATIPPDRLFKLRYEDLVNDYEGLSHQVFTWLGLEAEPVDRFLAHFRNVDAHTLALAETITADFRTKSVNRWRRQLKPGYRQLANDLVGSFMERYGYDK